MTRQLRHDRVLVFTAAGIWEILTPSSFFVACKLEDQCDFTNGYCTRGLAGC